MSLIAIFEDRLLNGKELNTCFRDFTLDDWVGIVNHYKENKLYREGTVGIKYISLETYPFEYSTYSIWEDFLTNARKHAENIYPGSASFGFIAQASNSGKVFSLELNLAFGNISYNFGATNISENIFNYSYPAFLLLWNSGMTYSTQVSSEPKKVLEELLIKNEAETSPILVNSQNIVEEMLLNEKGKIYFFNPLVNKVICTDFERLGDGLLVGHLE